MYKAMKVLAIAALVVTIAGAGAVLYGVKTLEPVVEQAQVTLTPAADAQDVFDSVVRQLAQETFTGRVFDSGAQPDIQSSTFLTYTLRLANKGFFPAEWVSLDIAPAEGDVLQLDNYSANVLAAGSKGDIAATVLHMGDAANAARSYTVSCYVWGKKITLEGTVQ